MKSIFAVAISVFLTGASVSAQEAAITVVCNDAVQCKQIAQTIEQLNADRGLSGCGVVAGEKIVKYVDSEGKLMGYACVWSSVGGLF